MGTLCAESIEPVSEATQQAFDCCPGHVRRSGCCEAQAVEGAGGLGQVGCALPFKVGNHDQTVAPSWGGQCEV